MSRAAHAPQLNSSEYYRGILDNVMGVTPRERELIDQRELEGRSTPERIAEENALRAARGKPPLEEEAAETLEAKRLREEK